MSRPVPTAERASVDDASISGVPISGGPSSGGAPLQEAAASTPPGPLPTAVSITHEHVLGVLHTETSGAPAGREVRVLDAGCGDGQLLSYLAQCLARLTPSQRYELYGFDVVDHGVQASGFLTGALQRLEREWPLGHWRDRIAAITQQEPWPWPDGYFDVVVSNQVVEHVGDPLRFFGEVSRVLKPGGVSMHLFPLRHYVYEGHLLLPFVHRIRNFPLLVAYIRWMSRLGLGKFRAHHRQTGVSLETFAERHADYMHYYTHYLTYREALALGKRHGLRVSFRYTRDFYTRRLLRIVGKQQSFRLARQSAIGEWLAVCLLRYVSCVTLFLEKRETYRTKGGPGEGDGR